LRFVWELVRVVVVVDYNVYCYCFNFQLSKSIGGIILIISSRYL
jgi:hypothetical protein